MALASIHIHHVHPFTLTKTKKKKKSSQATAGGTVAASSGLLANHPCPLLRQRPFFLDGLTPSGATLRLAYEPPPLKKNESQAFQRCWLDRSRPPLGWSRRVPAPKTFLLADPSFILQAMNEDTLIATWASRKHAEVTDQ